MSSQSRTRTMNLTVATAVVSLMLQVGWSRGNVVTTPLPPQPLADALEMFAQRTGMQVIYSAPLAKDVMSRGAAAGLSAEQVLRELLRGTGLTFELVNDRTVTVRTLADQPTSSIDGRSEGFWERLRLAQANSDTPFPRVADAAGDKIEEVVITGSRIQRTGDGPQQVYTYTRDAIDNSGQGTIAGFLSTLPQVSTSTGENTSQLGFGQTTVQLRGLPPGSTLVLLNGRRLESVGPSYGSGGFFDLNLLPAAAVERIEVLPDSASAIYGSDALAGVVNIILKKDFSGAEAGVRYGFANGLTERSANFALGHQWERGGISVIGTYFDRPNRLGADERALTADKDYRRYGGPDTRSMRCNPGSVSSASGANLPGLGSPRAAIPAGLTGEPDITDFSATAGQTNLCSDLAKYVLVPESTRYGAVTSGHFQLAPSVDLFGEYIYSKTEELSAFTNRSLSNVLVPASNAFNPFGVDLRASYLFNDSQYQGVNAMNAVFTRAVGGARGELGSWHWEASAMQSRDRNRDDIANGVTNTAAINAALASSDPATALNVFTTGKPTSDSVLATLYGQSRGDFDSKLTSYSGNLRGSAFKLPAGELQLAFGVEYTREEMDTRYSSVVVAADRSTKSAFAEAHVPLLAREHRGASLETLALTGAVRLDDYSDFGQRTSPQVGLEWRPVDSILFRGSWGKAFRAPGLYVLYGQASPVFDTQIVDPRRGGEARTVGSSQGPNANLEPEDGKSKSVGFVWHSEQVRSLTAGMTYWSVDQSNRVSLLLPQAIVNNEAVFPGRVQRGPTVNGVPGAITFVDRSYLNVGELKVAGVDGNVDYAWRTRFGEWTPRLSVTYTEKYDTQLTPDSAVVDMTSRANILAWAPRWRGAVTVGWKNGPYSASVAGRYVGRYLDYQDWGANNQKIGNFWLADVSASVELGQALGLGGGAFSKAFASVAVANVFNSLPDWSYYQFSGLGYDPTQYDIIGRMAQFNLGVRW
ncbi:MAG: TonB-dependent receptor [Gammaproteobacteria bacterium]